MITCIRRHRHDLFCPRTDQKMPKLHSLLKNHRRTKSFADLFLQTDFCKSRILKESLLWSGASAGSAKISFRSYKHLPGSLDGHLSLFPATACTSEAFPRPLSSSTFLAPQHLPSAQTLASTQSTKLQPLLLRLQQLIANVSYVKGQIGRAVAGSLHERCYHVACHCVQASLEFFVFRTSPTKVHTL